MGFDYSISRGEFRHFTLHVFYHILNYNPIICIYIFINDSPALLLH